MADKNLNSVLFTSSKLTENRAAWNKAIKRLFRRAKRWEKQGIAFTDFPQRPDRVTKAHIAAVNKITKRNLTDVDRYQVQFVQGHPELTIEDIERYGYHGAPVVAWGETHKQELPLLNLRDYPELWDLQYQEIRGDKAENKWMSEEEWWGWDSPEPEEPPEIGPDLPPVVTAAEIDRRLDDIIKDCTQYEDHIAYSKYSSATEYRKRIASDYAETIKDAIEEIKNQTFKTKSAFYEYLQRPGVVQQLQELANRIYACYQRENSPERDRLLTEFMQTLNMGQPLTDYQYEVLQDTGQMEYDFGEEFDD